MNIFAARFSTLVTWASKKESVDQSESENLRYQIVVLAICDKNIWNSACENEKLVDIKWIKILLSKTLFWIYYQFYIEILMQNITLLTTLYE